MEKKEQEFKLTEQELLKLRLWCLDADRNLPIQLYNWLLKAESYEDLELRKKSVLVSSSIGSIIDQYKWVKYNIIPVQILNDPDYPALESDPL